MEGLYKKYQKILALVLAVLFFVTTSGINIYSHSCGCCQSFDVSLTAFDECCLHENAVTCNTSSEDHDECCSGDKMHQPIDQHQCKASGCCHYQHQFLKISEDFQFTLKINIPQISEFPVPEIVVDNKLNSSELHECFIVAGFSLPPPLPAGKVFHLMTQSLKIAPPSSIPVRKIALG